jgi:hypothetical protein
MEIVDRIWTAVQGAAAVAPLATFGVVLVAYLTYRQKTHADRRDQCGNARSGALTRP